MNKNFKTLELAIELHKHIMKKHLPSFRSDQILRASQSVALNLSEGAARFSGKEKRKFYRIAYGSLKETQVLIHMANIQDKEIIELSDKVGASIYKLLLALDKPKPITAN